MYQQLIILGNVGSSVEQRFTPSGVAVTTFSLAVNRRWNNADGQAQEKTTWYRVTCWRKLAETVAQYVVKGQQVLVIGEEVEARAFTDKAGENRASLEVTAREVRFLSKREAGETAERVEPEDGGSDIPF
jgi:single-strand DNA-binding protein